MCMEGGLFGEDTTEIAIIFTCTGALGLLPRKYAGLFRGLFGRQVLVDAREVIP